jgi:hypothetical protein
MVLGAFSFGKEELNGGGGGGLDLAALTATRRLVVEAAGIEPLFPVNTSPMMPNDFGFYRVRTFKLPHRLRIGISNAIFAASPSFCHLDTPRFADSLPSLGVLNPTKSLLTPALRYLPSLRPPKQAYYQPKSTYIPHRFQAAGFTGQRRTAQ